MPLNPVILSIEENVNLHIVELKEIDEEIKKIIDKTIIMITHGPRKIKLNLVKKKINNFLAKKKDTTLESGAIAEFFIHLYLRTQNYKQECLFHNLEESGSIKKGFDGYYTKDKFEWIMESKSVKIDETNLQSHKSNIKNAYKDLNSKIMGDVTNNPWDNAIHHMRNVGTEDSIVKSIELLSDKFASEEFQDIGDFNIIPSSTIFLNNIWSDINIIQIENDIKTIISDFKFKKLEIICFTNISIETFKNYLNLQEIEEIEEIDATT